MNLNNIDSMKFIMSLLVIAIHVRPFEGYHIQILFDKISPIAVPFFFIASGYLLSKNFKSISKEEINFKLSTYLKKTISLYLIWTVIYLPFTIYGCLKEEYNLKQSILSFVRGFLFIGENYYSWPLWYLLALIISVYIIKLLINFNISINKILLISIFLTLIGLYISNFASHDNLIISLYYKLFSSTRNGFFVGLLYVSIGFHIALKGGFSNKFNKIIILVCSIGIAFNVPFSVYLFSYSLFNIVINSNSLIYDIDLNKNLRSLSTTLYLTHMIFYGIIRHSFLYHYMSSAYLFIITTILCISLGCFIISKQDNKYIKLCFN